MTFPTARQSPTLFTRTVAVLASVAAVTALASCAKSERDTGGTTTTGGDTTFTFAASADPAMLDPAMASEGETFRVTRQIFEGLVATKPGTLDLEPSLATKWATSSSDRKSVV